MAFTSGAMAVAGGVMSASASAQQGAAAKQAGAAAQNAANYSAAGLDQEARQVRAQASGQVADIARNTQLQLSSARARAASSGASATDPTSVNIASTIAGRGEYGALGALYTGAQKAQGLNNQATLDRYNGQQAFNAGLAARQIDNTKAIATLFDTGSSLAGKYGSASKPPTQGTDAAAPGFDLGVSDIGGFQ